MNIKGIPDMKKEVTRKQTEQSYKAYKQAYNALRLIFTTLRHKINNDM